MENKRITRRIASAIVTTALVLASLFAFTACGTDGGDSAIKITSTRINDHGELIITYSDGTEANVGVLPNGDETTVIIEGEEGDISAASAAGLASAVSITANFEKTVNNNFGGFFPGFGSSGSSTQEYSSEGSGVIYQLDKSTGSAFIITNYHVVYDASSNTGISEDISLFLYGAEASAYAIPAEYVGGSLYYDIAVLYVEGSEAMKRDAVKAVTVAESAAEVGTNAIAVGNPEGAGISASLGIVSVDSEYITMTAADGYSSVSTRVMRVDTAVNSGNSGGGLYNGHGELIGIVNAKIVDSSVENIAYAIPTAVATAVADNIIDNCFEKDNNTVMRAILGITLASTDSGAIVDTESGMLKIVETVCVASVEKTGIANDKLLAGDILVSAALGDKTVTINRQYQIIDLMIHARVGDTLTVKVIRGGVETTVEISIPESAITAY